MGPSVRGHERRTRGNRPRGPTSSGSPANNSFSNTFRALARYLVYAPHPASFLVFTVSIIFSAISFFSVYFFVLGKTELAFDTEVQRAGTALESQLRTYVDALGDSAYFFSHHPQPTASQWSEHVGDSSILQQLPGITSMWFIEAVSSYDREFFVEGIKADVENYPKRYREFKIHPTSAAEVAFVVKLISPAGANQALLGYDFGVKQDRRMVLERARDTGKVVVSKESTLLSHDESLLLSMPVYGANAILSNVFDRRNAFQGFVVLALDPMAMSEHLFNNSKIHTGLSFGIYEGNSQEEERLLYLSSTSKENKFPVSFAGNDKVVKLDVGSQVWTVQFQADGYFGLSTLMILVPFIVLVVGVLLSIVVSYLINNLLTRRYEAEGEVMSMSQVLKARQEQFQILAEASPLAIFIASAQGEHVYSNSMLRKVCGLSRDKVSREKWTDRIHPDEREPLLADWANALDAGVPFETDLRFVHSDDTILWAHLRALPIRKEGSLYCYVGTIQDTTDSRKNEAMLGDYIAELSASRTAFHSHAHQLNFIIRHLSDPELASGSRVSRMSVAQALGTKSETCCPAELLAEIASQTRERAMARGISLGIENIAPTPISITTDSMLLKKVLLTLVENAVRSTEIGGVKVVTSFHKTTNRLIFEVVDTGAGIPTTGVSEAGAQAEGEGSQGTDVSQNLSLFELQQFARELGGAITVESTPGRGSVVILTIDPGECKFEKPPVVKPSSRYHSRASRNSSSERGDKKVLLAGSREDDQERFSTFLKELGFETVIATTSRTAIEKALTETFSLIVMDMESKVMDGVQAVKQLRQSGCSVSIIAFNSNGVSGGSVEQYQKIGCQDFIDKGCERDEFTSTVLEHCNKEVSSSETSRAH